MSRRPRKSRIIRALIAFALVAAFYAYAFRLARVQGPSMEPTFRHGQWLLVRRLNWPAPPLAEGEVIVFQKGRESLVKRIAALPGEPFPGDPGGRVPDGHLFVLGDNPERSDDSRNFGPIALTTVLGRVIHWTRPPRKPTAPGE